MTQPRSNSRRFVNAAWSLLTFQLIASAGAVGVTAVAAFHVSDLVNPAQQSAGSVEEATVTPLDNGAVTDDALGLPQVPPAAVAVPVQVAPARPADNGPGSLTLAPDGGTIYTALSDPDDISRALSVQWFRNAAPVAGASGMTYNVGYEDSQAVITARIEYVDGDGFTESVTSAPIQIGVITP